MVKKFVLLSFWVTLVAAISLLLLVVDNVFNELGRKALVDYAQIVGSTATAITLIWLVYANNSQQRQSQYNRSLSELSSLIREFKNYLNQSDLLATYGIATNYISQINSILNHLKYFDAQEHLILEKDLKLYIELHYLHKLRVESFFEAQEETSNLDFYRDIYPLFCPHLPEHLLATSDKALKTKYDRELFGASLAYCMYRLYGTFEYDEAAEQAFPKNGQVIPIPILLDMFVWAHEDKKDITLKVAKRLGDDNEVEGLLIFMLASGYIALSAYLAAFLGQFES